MTKGRKRKYEPANLLPALRFFAGARREALSRALISDNGGAIHSAERIANILGQAVCYPYVSHSQLLKSHPNAHCSVAAHEARQRGENVEIEHVLPLRAYTQHLCELIEAGATDGELLDFVRANYRLVLLTKEERSRLDKVNRTRLVSDRLAEAGIVILSA